MGTLCRTSKTLITPVEALGGLRECSCNFEDRKYTSLVHCVVHLDEYSDGFRSHYVWLIDQYS